MLNIAILERNQKKRNSVAEKIKGLNIDAKVSKYSNPQDFIEKVGAEGLIFDAIFLNTKIAVEGDGVEFAAQLRENNKRIMICFVTESEDYYKEAIRLFATGYLSYPIDSGEIYRCLTFYFQDSNFERRATWTVKERGGNYRRLFCRNIKYIESDNRELVLYMEDGSTIQCYGKLNDVEPELPGGLFIRCHQSFIVNMYFAEELTNNAFLIDGKAISVSRKHQKVVKEMYQQFRNRKK